MRLRPNQPLDAPLAHGLARAVDALEGDGRAHGEGVPFLAGAERDEQHAALDSEIAPFGDENRRRADPPASIGVSTLTQAPLPQVEQRDFFALTTQKPGLSTIASSKRWGARAVFAAVVAMFSGARQAGAEAIAPAQSTHRVVADDGALVSPLSATRIIAAFSRFQRFILSGGG